MRNIEPKPGKSVLKLLGVAAVVIAVPLAAQPAGKLESKAGKKASGKASAAAPQDVSYVGSETCQLCHEDIFNTFKRNTHKILESDKELGWQQRACESCHGPGGKHVESLSASDIRNPGKLQAASASKLCLGCHLNRPTHAGRLESSHAKNQVSCLNCHSVHGSGDMVARGNAAINQQCAGCHSTVWAQFQQPYRHRVPEDAMSCVDCHNPHGTMRPASNRIYAANEPSCVGCHGDKRGPFAFEHAPVRLEGCGSCHSPHGSPNPRMLVQHEVRLVCLTCHANSPAAVASTVAGVTPPAFHDLRSPRYQNCTVCHQQIHGSHVDRNLLR
jgi:DmsE family decaheme c-type cytochrome